MAGSGRHRGETERFAQDRRPARPKSCVALSAEICVRTAVSRVAGQRRQATSRTHGLIALLVFHLEGPASKRLRSLFGDVGPVNQKGRV